MKLLGSVDWLKLCNMNLHVLHQVIVGGLKYMLLPRIYLIGQALHLVNGVTIGIEQAFILMWSQGTIWGAEVDEKF